MGIHIDAEQWPMAAGCIGLAKLYEEDELPRTATGIILKEEILDSLAEKYIYALIDMFSIVKRDVKRFEWFAKQAEQKPEQTKHFAAEVRKGMNEQYKKVEKYFADTEECARLKLLVEGLKAITKAEEKEKISEAILEYEEIMKAPFINERLTLNYTKAVVLNPFFGQTSILQPSFNSKNTEEHIEQIKKDFIEPAKLEILLSKLIEKSTNPKEILKFLEENKDYKPIKSRNIKPFKDDLTVLKKLNSLNEIKDYYRNSRIPCSFIDGFNSTISFEEMIFSPLTFSKVEAINFSWNFDKKLPVPISALARLIMFLAPYGMAFYSRRLGNENVGEPVRFAGMMLNHKHFSEVIKENITYQTFRHGGSSFEEAIIGLISENVDKAKKIKSSYFFVEMYSNYQMKKTLLDYYHMPPYLVRYLEKYGKALSLLLHRELREAFFRSVLKGIDPKEILFRYLHVAVNEPFHAEGAYHATRERRRLIEAKGVKKMWRFDEPIEDTYKLGCELRNKMIQDRSGGQEGEPYRASGQKKLEGIAYRLLNAAKAGNKQAFMDTIFRIHMAADLDVPSVFVESFKEEGLDFASISSAFIAGLLSDEKTKNEKGAVANE